MTIIEAKDYRDVPKGAAYVWVAAATFDEARRQVRRDVGEVVYHWKNLWAFEVVG